jgi:hypothetical protein
MIISFICSLNCPGFTSTAYWAFILKTNVQFTQSAAHKNIDISGETSFSPSTAASIPWPYSLISHREIVISFSGTGPTERPSPEISSGCSYVFEMVACVGFQTRLEQLRFEGNRGHMTWLPLWNLWSLHVTLIVLKHPTLSTFTDDWRGHSQETPKCLKQLLQLVPSDKDMIQQT